MFICFYKLKHFYLYTLKPKVSKVHSLWLFLETFSTKVKVKLTFNTTCSKFELSFYILSSFLNVIYVRTDIILSYLILSYLRYGKEHGLNMYIIEYHRSAKTHKVYWIREEMYLLEERDLALPFFEGKKLYFDLPFVTLSDNFCSYQ